MRAAIILSVTIGYFALMAGIGIYVRKHAKSSEGFTSGGRTFPAFLIGGLMLSEFIGSSVSIGTAQKGFTSGISATWNLVALASGFLILGLLLSKKYRESGFNTISAVLANVYGEKIRYAASVLSIIALSIVTVALYASGGAVLAQILDIPKVEAILMVGFVTVLYVSIGGMRSIVYTNFFNAIVKYIGVTIALLFALTQVGGIKNLQLHMPAETFSWTHVGFGQIIAWFIAGIGSILATQYVIQSIVTTPTNATSRRACLYVSTFMIPFGIAAALIGICSAYLYPDIKSIDAFPHLITQMPTISASIVVIGLAGAMLGGISANTIASSTLALKDFYEPYFNKEKNDKKSIFFLRVAIIVIGLVPLVLAVYADQILAIAFLGKALRATLAVLVVTCFYFPRFGSAKGAFIGVILSVICTIGWYILGDPFGFNSSYFSFLCPVVTMTIAHLMKGQETSKKCIRIIS